MPGAVQKDTDKAPLAQARRCCYSSNMDAEMVHNSQPMQLVTIFRQQQTLVFCKNSTNRTCGSLLSAMWLEANVSTCSHLAHRCDAVSHIRSRWLKEEAFAVGHIADIDLQHRGCTEQGSSGLAYAASTRRKQGRCYEEHFGIAKSTGCNMHLLSFIATGHTLVHCQECEVQQV